MKPRKRFCEKDKLKSIENIDKILEKIIRIKAMLDEINSEVMKEINKQFEEIEEIKEEGERE